MLKEKRQVEDIDFLIDLDITLRIFIKADFDFQRSYLVYFKVCFILH